MVNGPEERVGRKPRQRLRAEVAWNSTQALTDPNHVPLRLRDILVKLYEEQKMSVYAITKAVGLRENQVQTVYGWMKAYNIPRVPQSEAVKRWHNTRLPQERSAAGAKKRQTAEKRRASILGGNPEKTLRALKEKRKTDKNIGSAFGVPRPTIEDWRKIYGIAAPHARGSVIQFIQPYALLLYAEGISAFLSPGANKILMQRIIAEAEKAKKLKELAGDEGVTHEAIRQREEKLVKQIITLFLQGIKPFETEGLTHEENAKQIAQRLHYGEEAQEFEQLVLDAYEYRDTVITASRRRKNRTQNQP